MPLAASIGGAVKGFFYKEDIYVKSITTLLLQGKIRHVSLGEHVLKKPLPGTRLEKDKRKTEDTGTVQRM
jgi:hypothetical protein